MNNDDYLAERLEIFEIERQIKRLKRKLLNLCYYNDQDGELAEIRSKIADGIVTMQDTVDKMKEKLP